MKFNILYSETPPFDVTRENMATLARVFSKSCDRFLVASRLSTKHRDLSGTVSSIGLSHKTSRVYLLNQYKEPEIDLHEALRALRAYSLCERAETIEVSLKCNMKVKKVGLLIISHNLLPHS